jgi:hypothetical protein
VKRMELCMLDRCLTLVGELLMVSGSGWDRHRLLLLLLLYKEDSASIDHLELSG